MTVTQKNLADVIVISIYLRRDTHDNGMTLKEYADGVIAGLHPILSYEECVYQFGAVESELNTVVAWANSNSLTVTQSDIGKAIVKVQGTVEQFNNLFGIVLQTVDDSTRIYQTYQGTLTIPPAIEPVIEQVLGFDKSFLAQPHLVPADAIAKTDIPLTTPLTGNTLAVCQCASSTPIITEGGGSVVTAVVYNNGTAGVGATLTITTTSQLSIDRCSLSQIFSNYGANSRVLIKNEDTLHGSNSNPAWNGIYNVISTNSTQTILRRSSDFNTPSHIYSGWTQIEQGYNNVNSGWLNTNTPTVTIGTTPITFTSQNLPNLISLTPPQVASIYNVPAGTGAGGCIAIMALTTNSGYQTGYNMTDVTNTFAQVGLSAPTIVNVSVDGAQPKTTTDVETMLDFYCAGAVVPNAKIAYYTLNQNNNPITDLILAVAADTVNSPSVLSMSWLLGDSSVYTTSLQTCVVRGITPVIAAGDTGIAVGYGASNIANEYCISAGGTSLWPTSGNNRFFEESWIGSGGGISTVNPIPSWQNGLTYRSYLSTSGNNVTVGSPTTFTGRGTPDISAPANPNTGYQFYVNSSLVQYGGTSASAPLLSGIFVRLIQLLGGRRIRVPFSLFYSNPSAFYDITAGNNQPSGSPPAAGYSATSGWDGVTGLGAPIGTSLLALLQNSGTNIQVKTAPNTWQPVNTISIKTSSNAWSTVQHVYIKTSANTWQQTY